jgi:hypothetical protein
MADGDLLLIFRQLDTGDLQDRRDDLLGKMTTITSMGVGSKNFVRDLRHLKDQLAAIMFVLKERTTPYHKTILTDFSRGGLFRGEPAGSEESLSS